MKLCKLSTKDGDRLAQRVKNLVHRNPGGAGYLVSLRTAESLKARDVDPFELSPELVGAARLRLVKAWASAMNDALPDSVLEEATLLLHANPELQLEYMGRGRIQNEKHMPVKMDELVMLDHALGKRTYLLRRMRSPVGELDDRAKHVSNQFQRIAGWLNDPGARLVLSLGGGAMRMFAATPVLRAIDLLLGGDRTKVHEVWGSSGGAFLGYVYSHGFDMRVVDEVGFDIYHGRTRHLINPSLASLVKYNLAGSFARLRGQRPRHPFEGWADELDSKQPKSARKHAEVAYFAMATNTRSAEPIALGEERFIPPSCRDLVFACDSRHAMCASTSVPFLISPHRGITGATDDTWIDGSITDENPLALPFAKWLREKKADPDHTPKRLKIVSVHLNLRMGESELVNRVAGLPILKQTRFVKHAGRLFDMSLDSKTFAPLKILTSVPEVEVFTLKLSLGWLNLNSVRDIPAAVRAGRTLEAWKMALYADGQQTIFQAPTAALAGSA